MVFKKILHTVTILIFPVIYLFSQNGEVLNYTTSDGLSQSLVNQMMFDKNDNLWIGTNGGLCVFDGQKIQKIEDPRLYPRIMYIHKDAYGSIYVADEKNEIFRVNKLSNSIEKINSPHESLDNWIFGSTKETKLKEVVYKNHNRIFLIHDLGYRNFKKFEKNKSEVYFEFDEKYDTLKKFFLLDTLIIGITNQNNWIKFNVHHKEEPIFSNLTNDFITKGFLFNTDDDTYSLYNKTIYKLKLVKNSLIALPILFEVSIDPIADNIISGQYNPKTGNFYFGSALKGLFEVKEKDFTIKKHQSKDFRSPNFIAGPYYFYSQAEIDSSELFINNFLILKGTSDLFNMIEQPNNRAMNFVDQQGILWYGDGQNIVKIKGAKKSKIPLSPINAPIISMCQISINKYLLLGPNFIIELDSTRETRRFTLGAFEKSNYEYSQYIFHNKSMNKIYVLSNKKIYTVDLENEQIIPNSSLKEADFRIMSPLSENIDFVGTYGQGYYLKKDDLFIPIPFDKNGYLKFAHAALCDENGHVWISTNNGLFRTRFEDMMSYIKGESKGLFYYYYDKSSGFLTNEFNGGCQSPAIKLKDGRFSFSSMDGLVQFDPLKVHAVFPLHPPKIISQWLNDILQDSISPELKIKQNIKDIKLELSAPYYGHIDNFIIEYQLANNDSAWKTLDQKRYISLQNLSHGAYNLKIRVRKGFGPNEYYYLNYKISVLPYFFQTWWFKMLVVALVFFLFYLFTQWYNKYSIQKNMELEMLIAQKNKGLLQVNKTLREQIKQNDLIQSVFVHDIKSPIRFIKSNSMLLKDSWNKLNDDVKINNISYIQEAADKINYFIEETILWINLRNDEVVPQLKENKVLPILLEILSLYKEDEKIIKGNITIYYDCDKNLQWCIDGMLMRTILRNFLSNSIKYSKNGTICVYAYTHPNGKNIIGCKDEGKGINDALINQLLSENYQGNAIREDSFRMGYIIIKEIVKLIGGKLYIQSTLGVGTNVWVEF